MNAHGKDIIFWGKKQARPQLDVWLPEWQTYAQGVCLSEPSSKAVLKKLMKRLTKSRIKIK